MRLSWAFTIAAFCAASVVSSPAWAETTAEKEAKKEAERVEYGEYLSGSCVTCHQLSGTDNGIPSIVGWDKETFVEVMTSYKTKERDNKAMQGIAGPLSQEEMQALASYFATKKAKDE